jgi:hypothetical protein
MGIKGKVESLKVSNGIFMNRLLNVRSECSKYVACGCPELDLADESVVILYDKLAVKKSVCMDNSFKLTGQWRSLEVSMLAMHRCEEQKKKF